MIPDTAFEGHMSNGFALRDRSRNLRGVFRFPVERYADDLRLNLGGLHER
jgi:hypothetical protein